MRSRPARRQPHEAIYRGDVDALATRDLAASILLLPKHLGDGEPTPSHTLFTFTAIVKSYCSSVSSTIVWSPANTPALLTMTSSRPTDHGYALAGEDQRDRTAVVRVDPVTTTTLSSKRFPTCVPLCSLSHVSVIVSISYACVKRCFHRSQRSENSTQAKFVDKARGPGPMARRRHKGPNLLRVL